MTDGIDIRDAFFDAVLELAKADRRMMFLTADMSAFSLAKFKAELPGQFLNVGISEQALIDVATGLALGGRTVFAYGIAAFVTARCYEQIKADLSGMRLPVTVIGSGGGLVYGSDGPSHHAIQDMSMMMSLPNMTVFNPADAATSSECARQAVASRGPAYVSLDKGTWPELYPGSPHDFGEGLSLRRRGRHATLVSVGTMTHTALAASDLLGRQGLDVSVVDVYRPKPLNRAALNRLLETATVVVTLEEGVLNGGVGSQIAMLRCAQAGSQRIRSLGLPDEIRYEYGSREWLLRRCGLDVESVAEVVRSMCIGPDRGREL